MSNTITIEDITYIIPSKSYAALARQQVEMAVNVTACIIFHAYEEKEELLANKGF